MAGRERRGGLERGRVRLAEAHRLVRIYFYQIIVGLDIFLLNIGWSF